MGKGIRRFRALAGIWNQRANQLQRAGALVQASTLRDCARDLMRVYEGGPPPSARIDGEPDTALAATEDTSQ